MLYLQGYSTRLQLFIVKPLQLNCKLFVQTCIYEVHTTTNDRVAMESLTEMALNPQQNRYQRPNLSLPAPNSSQVMQYVLIHEVHTTKNVPFTSRKLIRLRQEGCADLTKPIYTLHKESQLEPSVRNGSESEHECAAFEYKS